MGRLSLCMVLLVGLLAGALQFIPVAILPPVRPTPAPPRAPLLQPKEGRQCTDFLCHEQAQAFFLAQGGPSRDPYRLDGDGDGLACEELPPCPHVACRADPRWQGGEKSRVRGADRIAVA